jgi:hypothetical protein
MPDFIEQLITKHLEPFLSPLWDSVLFWRSAALFVIVLFLIIYTFKNRLITFWSRDKYQEHDRKIFEKLNSMIDEQTFRDLCMCIRDYNYFDGVQMERLHQLDAHGNNTEILFLTPSLQKAFSIFHGDLDRFLTCVGGVFFTDDVKRWTLYPELVQYADGVDSRERKCYLDARDEVMRHSNKVLASYETYRKKVKTVLHM